MTNDSGYEQFEAKLLRQRSEADPAFEQSLRRRLLQAYSLEFETRTVHMDSPRLRWAVLAGVLLLVLALLTPAGRALAQQILQLGIFTITRQPSAAEQVIQDPIDPAEVHTVDTLAVEAEQASRLAGFEVYLPSYIPAGYQPADEPPITLLMNDEGQATGAEMMLIGANGGDVLFFSQQPFPPEEQLTAQNLGIGQAEVESVEVGGNRGLWLPDLVWGTRLDDQGLTQPVIYSVIIWVQPEADGSDHYFWLGSQARLSKDVMLRIANSVQRQ